MKSLKTIQTLSKMGKTLSKIAFVFAIIGFCGCIAGLISLNFDSGSLIKIGGVTLHGIIANDSGYNIESIGTALAESHETHTIQSPCAEDWQNG